MKEIAWLFIYMCGFGISEYILSKYVSDNEFVFYIGLGLIGILLLFYYKQIN